MKKGKELVFRMAVPLLVGGLAALLTSGTTGKIYSELRLPPLSPPGWVFPLVWTILYILMGISAYLIATSGCENRERALFFYHLQLILNLLWPILFFRFTLFFAAAVEILLLLLFVTITVFLFLPCKKLAGWLLLPYLVWTMFASYLSIAVAVLNR